MGVPAFYRWITEKYGKVVVDILEKRPVLLNGMVMQVDLNEPNPNQFEFDNLYVDMNGLIHPCSHPEDREAPTTEEEMYINVTKYVDRLVAAIRPRNLLYLAIDGVAPRAKMNQQRSRRFRSAQEAKERKEMRRKVLNEMEELGIHNKDEDLDSSDAWDSNVITPGTEFMFKLSAYLKFYIVEKMNTDPFWQKLTVILSDASEPGEGEHKIMDFIRRQRCQPNYNPNIHHVIHGLDADLIMLALATHEPHFTILREKVFFGKKGSNRSGEKDDGTGTGQDSSKSDAQRLFEIQNQGAGQIYCDPNYEWIYNKPLEALHVFYLREYLEWEFQSLQLRLQTFPYQFERIIDDFIFLCFFVGNDFLPHLPSLDIRDGALDFLIECYKEVLPSLGDYITRDGGEINLMQADVILSKVGEIEDLIFQRKKFSEDQSQRRFEQRKQQQQSQQQSQQSLSRQSSQVSEQTGSILGKRKESEPTDQPVTKKDSSEIILDDEEVEELEKVEEDLTNDILKAIVKKKQQLQDQQDKEKSTSLEVVKTELKTRLKAKEQEMIDSYKTTIVDTIKLHEQGWKDRYYQDPFKKKDIEQGGGFQKMCYTYVQGLCWVFKYYYQGVPSWNWYYPFHYAPFASDLVNIDRYGEIEFEKSQPFSPLEQLLAVLPASSHHALPEECHWLMLDPESPIIDIYNEDIPIDANGKHLPWLWILLLPFLEESRIAEAFNGCRAQLTYHSLERNRFGESVIFMHQKQSKIGQYCKQAAEQGLPLFQTCARETDPYLLDYLSQHPEHPDYEARWFQDQTNPTTEPMLTYFQENHKLFGQFSLPPKKWYLPLDQELSPPPRGEYFWAPISSNQVICLRYLLPPVHHPHRSQLLSHVQMPARLLTPNDYPNRRPPRLNRSGFNILELFNSNNSNNHNNYNNNSHHQQNGRFQNTKYSAHQQPQHNYQQGYYQHHPNQNSFHQLHQQLNYGGVPAQVALNHQQYQQQSHHSQNSHRGQGRDDYQRSNHHHNQNDGNRNNNNSYPSRQQSPPRQSLQQDYSHNQQHQNYSGHQLPPHTQQYSAYAHQQQPQYLQHQQQQQQYYPPQAPPVASQPQRSSQHRIEVLQNNINRAINQSSSRPLPNSRPSKIMMVPAVPLSQTTAHSAQSFSFNSRSLGNARGPPGYGSQPQPTYPNQQQGSSSAGPASMQAMRDQLLQTMNQKRGNSNSSSQQRR